MGSEDLFDDIAVMDSNLGHPVVISFGRPVAADPWRTRGTERVREA
jgi:hypothetical protein